MPWKPSFEGEVPTLGFTLIDWYREMLATPDGEEYEPFAPYLEQEDFILNWYALDPATGKRVYTRGVLGRPRGWGKSPLLGCVAIGEAFGPVLFDGWDAAGQPVGKPWRTVRRPLVHIAACSDSQTDNTWLPIQGMLKPTAPIHNHYALTVYDSYVDMAYGKIERITSAARSRKGNPVVFAVLDQTEEWVPSNGGPTLANTLRSNVGKMGGTSIESPNAYKPGEASVAEDSANYWQAIRESRALDDGLLYDHREAPADTDMSDHDSLLEGLRVSYGDSSNDPRGCVLHDPPCPPGHADIERNIRTIWDPAFDPQTARSDYLNQITHASDAWMRSQSLQACIDLCELETFTPLQEGDTIVLGFDGSRGRNKGNPDATALVGCRVSDGYLFEIKIWQAKQGERDWLPPVFEINMFLDMVFEKYNVVAFYADPSGWSEHVATWESPKKFGRKLKVKASQEHPIAAWPRGKDSRVTEYLRRLKQVIDNTEIPVEKSPMLYRHFLNARMRKTKVGYQIYKAYPDSPDKIDGAYAAMLAYKARTDALSAGLGFKRPTTTATTKRGRITVS
ncbi:MAG: hypothetical protein LC723_12300 [Actinobacteria bacterium]|nr:hypothetical protein [Actinomycetota bacterium]